MSSYFGAPICFFEKKLEPAGSLTTSAVASPPAGDLTIPTLTPSSVSMNRPVMIESPHHLLVNTVVRGKVLMATCPRESHVGLHMSYGLRLHGRDPSSSITYGGGLRACAGPPWPCVNAGCAGATAAAARGRRVASYHRAARTGAIREGAPARPLGKKRLPGAF